MEAECWPALRPRRSLRSKAISGNSVACESVERPSFNSSYMNSTRSTVQNTLSSIAFTSVYCFTNRLPPPFLQLEITRQHPRNTDYSSRIFSFRLLGYHPMPTSGNTDGPTTGVRRRAASGVHLAYSIVAACSRRRSLRRYFGGGTGVAALPRVAVRCSFVGGRAF
jgi:hypothetical protein